MSFQQPSFAQVRLDRRHKKLEIHWLAKPAQKDYLFLMNVVKKLMEKHQIQQLVENNLDS